ncbi:hypothetical protein LPB140_05645 [Sphingorhabdus lutea]|uniref:Glycosyl transferase family 1 domain-containing protein n=1 Tax=Sphingorhabdus lutea TaxID=1913578 RepID=A0A1L3JB48_9SPHN|nr:glycosyltransferase family 4 protein [Sphingorhabdus lutea]APG62365.1 hypothetical protein LPB140_05645 [Sphingorhabdus lutea]
MSKKFKILHLHGSFDRGGKEVRCAKLMNDFGEEAAHVILSADNDAISARELIDKNIKVSFPGDAAPALHGMPSMGRYVRLAEYMRGFDLILSYNWGAMDGVMAHTLFQKSRHLPPLIHHEDGFNADEINRLKTKRNIFRALALSRAYALIMPSETLVHIAKNKWHQNDSKIRKITNGIDVDAFEKLAKADALSPWRAQKGRVTVGTVAGLRGVKNLGALVDAVHRAGDNIDLVIVGEGPERPALEAKIADMQMHGRVTLVGHKNNANEYIGLFDIFALSSLSEQAPISLMEAMAAAVPVASFDVGDVMPMVTQINREYIVPKQDVNALANAIKILAGDAKLRKKLGDANRARAQAEFNLEKMIIRYRMIYGAAMKSSEFARQV